MTTSKQNTHTLPSHSNYSQSEDHHPFFRRRLIPEQAPSNINITLNKALAHRIQVRISHRPDIGALSTKPTEICCTNLIQIPIKPSICKAAMERTHFVPSILLSNTMSLAPKIDEIAISHISNNIDVALFSESWLKESIPDDAINITGYQLLRRDRQHKSHGGVCLYIKKTIPYVRVTELESDHHEVLWVALSPRRLPREYSNIIIAVIYHPPDANCETMREYIQSSLEHIESSFPNSAVIIAGDFNKLDLRSTVKVFQLKPVIDFLTRGANILDQIYTNLSQYYSSPLGAPPPPPLAYPTTCQLSCVPAKGRK